MICDFENHLFIDTNKLNMIFNRKFGYNIMK